MKLDNLFGIHEQALKLRAQRSEVLAANLANADTPGFKARDFDFDKMLHGQMQPDTRLAATNNRHIGSSPSLVPDNALQYRVPLQPSVDGNTVDAEQEQNAFSRNAMEYQASLRFLDGRIRGLLSAIRGD
jgi:flagellar basal-body rod protein FlgB